MKTLLRRTRRAWAVAFVAAAALTACAKDSTTESSTVFGAYSVTTIDGHALPYTTQVGITPVTFLAGTLTLNSDHTFVVVYNLSATSQGFTALSTETQSGTYSVSGSTITLVQTSTANTVTSTGTIAGGTLNITSDGRVLVFNKT